MKAYTDEGVIPQYLFKHKVAPVMSGLISNVQMMFEELDKFPAPEWANYELSEDYDMRDAIFNMRTELQELRQIHREFIEYLDSVI